MYQLSDYAPGGIIHDVSKAYHGIYLYKVEYNIPAGWWLRGIPPDWEFSVFSKTLADAMKAEESGYSNKFYSRRSLENASPKLLWEIHLLRSKRTPDFITRLEHSTFAIYTKTEAELIKIITDNVRARNHVKKIFAPKNDASAELLTQGIIFQANPKFKFKVTIKEGKFTATTKEHIIQFLDNAGEKIYIPHTLGVLLRSNISSPYLYGHYYTNDDALLVFLRLIAPRFVGKIHRIEQRL